MNTPLVINLISGPGARKSTTAAGIFYELKKLGIKTEQSLEFAKDKVYEESFKTMSNQIYIFGKQHHRMWRLKDKVDVIITDSSLLVSLYYNKEESQYFNDLVVEQYHKFNNRCYFINRDGDYKTEGRIQTKEEAERIDDEILGLLDKYNIEYKRVKQKDAVDVICKNVLELLKSNE